MLDGLVVDSNGTKAWYLGGLLHRWDGPAIVYGCGLQEWRIEGNDITGELSKYFGRNLDYESLTKSELLIFKLKWN